MAALKDSEASSSSSLKPCSRCKTNPVSVQARGDPMCTACFGRYIYSKVTKRMEPYKYRASKPCRKLLLALSLGVSSLSLLHILSMQLQRSQEQIGKCGYDLHVCILGETSPQVSEEQKTAERNQDLDRVRRIKEAYFDDRDKWPMIKGITYMPTEALFDAIKDDNAEFQGLLQSCQIPPTTHSDAPSGPSRQSYSQFLLSLPSASARSDINTHLRLRLLTSQAHAMSCDTILFGSNTTRLAEQTLASTAQGRGFALPWLSSDGPTPYDLTFVHPLRDVLRKEIIAYAKLIGEPLDAMAKPAPDDSGMLVSSKDATIDGLMKQYFESVEKNFPSIVANVVRTGGRLNAPAAAKGEDCDGDRLRCEICALPVAEGTDGLHGWAGSMEDDGPRDGQRISFLCYGCARSMKGRTV